MENVSVPYVTRLCELIERDDSDMADWQGGSSDLDSVLAHLEMAR